MKLFSLHFFMNCKLDYERIDEGKHLFMKLSQIINERERIELEYHHFATPVSYLRLL